ncbi:Adenylate kinase [Candidatus Profftia lariciata]|uniref:adenylate kinase n=1 Tax=Candidatus Profftia lariciata TaxID=1987921 RepID=UPI001D016EA0|nr:adenylate kinase [Candidatus Profftia lariciata]UDG81485.1 Adenylate kinase [Candidatus Profftia lariciata]
MRIILLAPPGAGKGTQAHFITEKYNIPHISTGDMLRKALEYNSIFSEKIKEVINNGLLVTNDLVILLFKERIMQEDCQNGFLLDGFPRTIDQAEAIKAVKINIDFVLVLAVPEKLLIERIIGRRIHYSSGRIYHVKFNQPKVANKDDLTGENLVTRQDDKEEIVRNRLIEYQKQTTPLIKYYLEEAAQGNTKYFQLDGAQSIANVRVQLKNILG